MVWFGVALSCPSCKSDDVELVDPGSGSVAALVRCRRCADAWTEGRVDRELYLARSKAADKSAFVTREGT